MTVVGTEPRQQEVLGGRFVVEREVGRGGVGIVYRAFDRMTEQPVALKVIAVPGVDAGEEARFQREGRLLASLSHPGIVRLVAFGQLEEGTPYIAMEWLDGEDVAARMRRAPLSLLESLLIAASVAEALGFAHNAGIIHRDVKPSNIFVLPSHDGAPPVTKLVDFGVATADDVRLTRTGAIIGTPAYMAPEQARGDGEIDARADMYSLGATLFEMVAGRPPHVGPTPIAVLARLVTAPAPRLSDVMADAPIELDELLSGLLATHPSDRPSSALVVAKQLRRVARDVADHPGPLKRALGVSEIPAPLSGAMPTNPTTTSRSSGGTRLVTSILATHVPKGAPRARLLTHLRARGADATELGGDAVVAHLGVRRTLGDEAARAIDLALRLAKMSASVGIATGRVRVDRTRPIGEVVDRAAALARDSMRGQVLADATTSELARGRFEFQMRSDGTCVVGNAVRGKKEFVGGAPFVGREAELGQLMAAYDHAVEDRTPVIVTVTGPPGMGKTRLRREAVSRIASHPSAPRIVLARCETYSKSHTLGLVADVARGFAGLAKGASLEDALDATDALIATSEAELSEGARDWLARLIANEALPDTPDARGARDVLWIALTEIAIALARLTPLVLAIEDAQWADEESVAWLDHVLGRSADRTLWMMLTARPSFWREGPERFAGRDHVRLDLRPMGKKQLRAIAKAVLGEKASTKPGEELADSIAVQAAGSPLFAEELSRLAAHGRDAKTAPTIEAAMQVQLDALDDGAREAAAKLAVFGITGWDSGLAALGVPYAHDMLRMLSGSEVLLEQASSRFRDTREWIFKHAIMREVAYASLSDEALRTSHAAAGHWLAKMAEDDATVARHFELGGESELAAVHMERAARRALAANALQQAVLLAEKSLAFANDKPTAFARAQLLDEAWNRLDARAAERDSAVRAMEDAVHDPPSEIRARGARVRYEDACGGGPDTSAGLERVRRDAEALGVLDEETRCAAALAARYAFAGELEMATQMANHLLAIGQRPGSAWASVEGWQTLAVVHQTRGDLAAALDARRSAVLAASGAGLKTREATLTINVGFALTTIGAEREARAAIEAGIRLAQAIGSPGTERHGKMILLCWAATFGSDASLDALLAEPRAVADAAISGSWVPHDRATLGVLFYRGVELLRGDSDGEATAARALLRAAAQGYKATKMLDVVPAALGHWAEAERRSGDAARAREIASEAAALLDEGHPSLLNEAPVYLALHDANMELGHEDEARAAIARGVPRLQHRLEALAGKRYVRSFLLQLAHNAAYLTVAQRYGLLPEPIIAALRAAEAEDERVSKV